MSHTASRLALIQQIIPLLWDYPAGIPKSQWRSSYGAKHAVEHALQFYITNDEFIAAAVLMDVPHEKGDPNYRFGLKPRFPTDWFQPCSRLTERPKYESKKKWDAYQDACKTIDQLIHNLTKHDTSEDSRYTKITNAIGHWTPKSVRQAALSLPVG